MRRWLGGYNLICRMGWCLIGFAAVLLLGMNQAAMGQDTGTPPEIGLPPPPEPPQPTPPPPGEEVDYISYFYGGISAALYAYVDAGYVDPGMTLGIQLLRAEPQGAVAVACTEAWVDAIPQWVLVRAGDTWMCAQAERYTHYVIILRGLDERRYTDVYFKMCIPQRGGDWAC